MRFLVLALLMLSVGSAAQSPRDAVFVNGHVYTATDRRSAATAFSILDGRIMEVGSDEEVLAASEAGTQVLDLGGKTVVPGFIDSHGHLLNLGLSLRQIDLTGTASYADILVRVAERTSETPAGNWILGRGWDQNDWPVKDFPHHKALSAVTPRNPVALVRVDGHAMLVNAVALSLSGITAETPDPPGGKILRDSDGNPTGVIIDAAMGLVRRNVPSPTPDEKRAAVRSAIAECITHGITSVHDAGVDGDTIALYSSMIDANEFPFRVYAMIASTDVPTVNRFFETGPLIGYGDGRLTVRCVKVVADGALGSRGAALLAPYSDDPGNTGLIIVPQDALQALTARALGAGFQVATHAIGDRANRMTLDAYASALSVTGVDPKGNDKRLRVEHAQIVALDDIPRFAELGVIASMQSSHATSDMPWAEARVGPERIKGAYAWQRFLKSGSRIANGSDFPVEAVNPLYGFYAAITRQDRNGQPPEGWQPDQRMSRLEALRSFTHDAAFAAFEEADKGTLETGKRADFAVLNANIMEIPPAEILRTEVVMTFIGGKAIYTAPGF